MKSAPILALEHEIQPHKPPATMDQRARSMSSFTSEQEVQHGPSSRRVASSSPTEFDLQQPPSSSQSRLRSYSTTAACFPILPNPRELISTSPPPSRYTARPTSYQGPSSDFRHFASTYPTPSRSRSPSLLARNYQHEAYRALFMFDGLLLDEGRFRVTGFGHGPGLQQPALPPAHATALHLGSAYQPSPDGKPGASVTRGLFLQNIPADLQHTSLYKPLGIRPDVGEPRLSFLSCGTQNCSAVLVRYNSSTIAALERRRLDNFTLCGFKIRACFDHQLAVRDEDHGCNEGPAAPGLPPTVLWDTGIL